MLSQENINKLCMTGLYKANPSDFNLGSMFSKDPYWCRNWTFTVSIYLDNIVMLDTYWSSNQYSISLTDENFDKFRLLFDLKDVEECRYNIDDYDKNDVWKNIPIDSGGLRGSKNFIRKGAMPVKEKVIERLEKEIKDIEWQLRDKKDILLKVENDKIYLRYAF